MQAVAHCTRPYLRTGIICLLKLVHLRAFLSPDSANVLRTAMDGPCCQIFLRFVVKFLEHGWTDTAEHWALFINAARAVSGIIFDAPAIGTDEAIVELQKFFGKIFFQKRALFRVQIAAGSTARNALPGFCMGFHSKRLLQAYSFVDYF